MKQKIIQRAFETKEFVKNLLLALRSEKTIQGFDLYDKDIEHGVCATLFISYNNKQLPMTFLVTFAGCDPSPSLHGVKKNNHFFLDLHNPTEFVANIHLNIQGRINGELTEKRALAILQKAQSDPRFSIKSIQQADAYQDINLKIDFIVSVEKVIPSFIGNHGTSTVLITIPIQVKSSILGQENHMAKYPLTPSWVIHRNADDAAVLESLLYLLDAAFVLLLLNVVTDLPLSKRQNTGNLSLKNYTTFIKNSIHVS